MVRKTKRKQSAKRVRTNKRAKSRRRGRGRGHGRGCGGRTAKKGGMTPAARIVARTVASPALVHNVIYGRNPTPREGALVVNGTRYFGLPGDMPSQSMKEQAYKEYKEKTTPVELLSAADSAFSATHKAAYNDRQHDKLQQYQTPARAHTRNLFYTPHQRTNILRDDEDVRYPMPIFSSPADRISSDLSSPPPPDLFVQGTSKLISESPSFKRGFAITSEHPNPNDMIKKLDFGGGTV